MATAAPHGPEPDEDQRTPVVQSRRHRLHPKLRIEPKDGKRRGLTVQGKLITPRAMSYEPIPIIIDGKVYAAKKHGDGFIKKTVNIHKYYERATTDEESSNTSNPTADDGVVLGDSQDDVSATGNELSGDS